MAFVKVCNVDKIGANKMDSFYVNGQEVLVLRDRGGALRALDGICPHEDYPLVEGSFDGSTLTCAAHGWIFNTADGRGINPSNCRLTSFPVKEEGDEIQVDLDTELP